MSKNINSSQKIIKQESRLYDERKLAEAQSTYVNISKMIADEVKTEVDVDVNDLSTPEIIELAKAQLTPHPTQ